MLCATGLHGVVCMLESVPCPKAQHDRVASRTRVSPYTKHARREHVGILTHKVPMPRDSGSFALLVYADK